MSKATEKYLAILRNLNVNRRGDRRAPHKPLLLLSAIARVLEGAEVFSFSDVELGLQPLLKRYAPPVKGRHQPELPYWHLCSDKLWVIPDGDDLPRQRGGFPKMSSLRLTSGHLKLDFKNALLSDDQFLRDSIDILLSDHFPESLHEEILQQVGIALPETKSSRTRDPQFRKNVLRAYEHRCVVTGFRVALGGSYIGCEAAHIRWHAYGGPDEVENGLAVEPTIHKLFDAGAWTLTDDRRILVSSELTGTEKTIEMLRSYHGKPISEPVSGPSVSVEHISWHREPDLGGVFRHPSLPI